MNHQIYREKFASRTRIEMYMVCTPVKTIKSHTHVHRNFNEISRNVIVIHSDTESDISQETNNNIFNIVITDDAQETVDATETLGVPDNYSIHNDEINANIQSIGSVGVVNSARETVGAAETLDAHNNDSIDNSKTDVIIQSIGGVGGLIMIINRIPMMHMVYVLHMIINTLLRDKLFIRIMKQLIMHPMNQKIFLRIQKKNDIFCRNIFMLICLILQIFLNSIQ